MTETAPLRPSAFAFLPVGLFGSVMGLTGLSVAWRLAQVRYEAPVWIAETFVALAIGYAAKAVTAPAAVVAEFRDPIAGNLFGTLFISLLLIPILIAPYARPLARIIWGDRRRKHGNLRLGHRQPLDERPATRGPCDARLDRAVVGMLDLSLALPSLGLPAMHEVMVLGLAVGLFFAIPVFTLVFSRLLFEAPLPEPLQPSLLILIAPFSVGFSTHVLIAGRIDLFAAALYVLTLFILSVLVGRLRHVVACCPFKVSWSAVSFPLATSAIAAVRFGTFRAAMITDAIAMLLIGCATLAILALLGRTLWGIAKREIRMMSV